MLLVREMQGMRNGMTLVNHPLWFPLRDSPGSFPHSQGCGIKGFIPTSVIQGNLPLFMAGLSLGSPFRCITEVVVSHSLAHSLLSNSKLCWQFRGLSKLDTGVDSLYSIGPATSPSVSFDFATSEAPIRAVKGNPKLGLEIPMAHTPKGIPRNSHCLDFVHPQHPLRANVRWNQALCGGAWTASVEFFGIPRKSTLRLADSHGIFQDPFGASTLV